MPPAKKDSNLARLNNSGEGYELPSRVLMTHLTNIEGYLDTVQRKEFYD